MIPEVTVEAEIANVRAKAPHLVLLGAGASRAALSHGDRSGRPVPLLAEVADQLGLQALFPADLQALAITDFEAAYSRLYDLDPGISFTTACWLARGKVTVVIPGRVSP